MIEPAFDVVGAHQRGFVVERDQQAVDVLGIVDDAADVGCLGVVFADAQHDRLGAHGAAGRDFDVARGAMADRIDLVVVDPVDAVEALGHAEDPRQHLRVEDRAFLHLEHDRDVVGAAERRGVLIVRLDEGVSLREQLVEGGLEPEQRSPIAEHRGDQQDDHRDDESVLDQPIAEPVKCPFGLYVGLSGTHGRPSPWLHSQFPEPGTSNSQYFEWVRVV